MKFLPRAAIVAAVTFCAGALAHAATLDINELQTQLDQDLNAPEQKIVPQPQETAGSLPGTGEAKVAEAAVAAEPEAQFSTLSAAVAAQNIPGAADRELHCLAVGVYYEAKGEPLAGQLAVAEVILGRSTSGRFPRSVCSVLTQRGQFSFVRGGKLPSPPANAAWRKAVAVAQVAQKNLWDSPVDGALYFHARYVAPRWKRARVGSVGNHVFYR
jgi:spore germination cell wall hydrolase CwlJ-like protein